MPKIVVALAACLMLVAAGCKPKKPDPGANAALKTISGNDASGRDAALALLPLRNFSLAAPADAKNPGARQASAMARTRLFGLVECVAVTGASGETIDATSLMSAVEARAAIDDLYVDEARNLLTSKNDAQLAEFGSTGRKLIAIPCRLHGRRLLSWDALADLQMRAAGLTKNADTGNAATIEVYRLAQALHLSLRGAYHERPERTFMPRLPAILDMLKEQIGRDVEAKTVAERLRAADAVYNVCVEPSGDGKALAALRAQSFDCKPHPTEAETSIYRIGSGIGDDYERVKDRLALGIEGAHEAAYAESDSDPELWALWDLATSTAPFPTAGKRAPLALYLARGTGLDFDATFAVEAPGAKSAREVARRVDSSSTAAPLALGLPATAPGKLAILRATGRGDGDRPLLVGGTTSSAERRAATATGRITALAANVGGAGKSGLEKLGASVSGALTILRKAGK